MPHHKGSISITRLGDGRYFGLGGHLNGESSQSVYGNMDKGLACRSARPGLKDFPALSGTGKGRISKGYEKSNQLVGGGLLKI